jgi:hypothetical protein
LLAFVGIKAVVELASVPNVLRVVVDDFIHVGLTEDENLIVPVFEVDVVIVAIDVKVDNVDVELIGIPFVLTFVQIQSQ